MSENLPEVYRREQRNYIRVTPSTTEPRKRDLPKQAKRLHTLGEEILSDGIFNRLKYRLNLKNPPAIECLLVASEAEAGVGFYFSTKGNKDTLSALEKTLRSLFPDDYQFQREQQVLAPFDDGVRLMGQSYQRSTYQYVSGVEYFAEAEYRDDWQTRLTPITEQAKTHQTRNSTHQQSPPAQNSPSRSPLTNIIETMATSSLPMVYQLLLRPLPRWNRQADRRVSDIKSGNDTIGEILLGHKTDDPNELTLTQSAEQRCEEIKARRKRYSFIVNARVAILASCEQQATADHLATGLQSAFADVGGEFHWIDGAVCGDSSSKGGFETTGDDLLERILDRTVIGTEYETAKTWVPRTDNLSRGIVADCTELPHFFAIDGSNLTPDAQRALEVTPQAQTPVPQPPESVLERFSGAGLALGQPLTNDGTVGERIALPPAAQLRHIAWIGATGAGKSTSLISAMLANQEETEGANIVIDPKGGELSREYLRSHYAKYGTLENVFYFDVAEWLPALSFFDIGDELDAGVPRAVAVEDRIGHYEDLLEQFIGKEQYRRAVRSPDLITNVLRALYDPHHGDDCFGQRDLHAALNRLHEKETIPPVSDEDLERRLDGMVANASSRTFDDVMQGAKNRVEKLGSVPHLNKVFNNHPENGEAEFDIAEYLDDDVTIIFDIGRLRKAAKRGLTLVLLSKLWTALRRRRQRSSRSELPVVNVVLEEAGSVADSELVDRLLAQGREFGVSMTLAMQFPAQLEDEDAQTYAELLNNIGTYVTGNVGVDHDLAHRFATEAIQSDAVERRLRSLSPGQWLVDLPGAFNTDKPEPFLVKSLPLPEGHPAKDPEPPHGYTQAREDMVTKTRTAHSLSVGTDTHSPTTTDSDPDTETGELPLSDEDTLPSIFELTTRLPEFVHYDTERDALVCTGCENRYAPSATGMLDTIECCHSQAMVARDAIPVCSYHLTLTPQEIRSTDWTVKQLVFLQVVHNAQQRRYSQIEYDIVSDSMLRLKEYTGINQEAIDDLIEAGLLRHNSDHPHRLYSVTKTGREAVDEQLREGVDFGDGRGDLGESSQHVCGIETSQRYLEHAYVEDPESDVVEIRPYYELSGGELPAAAFMQGDADDVVTEYEQRRLDLVGLDADGNIILTVEVEKINNDAARAIPKDYDTMAACNPDEAIWVVMTQSAGHDVLEALNDPPEGQPRLDAEYASSTPPQQFTVDEPGLTAVYPISWLQNQLSE